MDRPRPPEPYLPLRPVEFHIRRAADAGEERRNGPGGQKLLPGQAA